MAKAESVTRSVRIAAYVLMHILAYHETRVAALDRSSTTTTTRSESCVACGSAC
jgi:hypothetical protein